MQTQSTSDILNKLEYYHDTLKRLEEYIKEGGDMPEIKYWSGTECFSDFTGHCKADTLAGSIDLYIDGQTAS